MDLLDFGIGPLRNYISESAYQEVLAHARRQTFKDREALHIRGDKPPRLCIVAHGVLRFGRFAPGGAFSLVSMLGAGGHFGDVALQRNAYTHDAFSVGESEVDIIDGGVLNDLLLNQSSFAIGLWRANTARLNAILELYDDARTLGVAARLAKVIYLHTGQGQIPNGVACLQRDLAELLAVSQVSIGTALKELEKEGLVKAGYRCVTVPDKAKLKAWLFRSRSI